MGMDDPDIENLGSMASGTLDPAFRLMLKTRSLFRHKEPAAIQEADLIASAFFEAGDEVPMRPGALESVMQRVNEAKPLPSGIGLPDYLDTAPYELRYLVARALEHEKWQPRGQGKRVLPLRAPDSRIAENGGGMVLFESDAGARVQRHKHLGEEYVLVLKGTIADEDGVSRPVGSLNRYEPGSVHAPRVGPHSDCAALVILTGGFEYFSSDDDGDRISA